MEGYTVKDWQQTEWVGVPKDPRLQPRSQGLSKKEGLATNEWSSEYSLFWVFLFVLRQDL